MTSLQFTPRCPLCRLAALTFLLAAAIGGCSRSSEPAKSNSSATASKDKASVTTLASASAGSGPKEHKPAAGEPITESTQPTKPAGTAEPDKPPEGAEPQKTPPADQPPTKPDGPADPETPTLPKPPLAFPGAELVNPQAPFRLTLRANSPDGRYHEGDKISLTLTTEKTAHIYLIYHQVDGRSVLIYPNPAERTAVVNAGEEVEVPREKGRYFRLKVLPPLGKETLQVLATPKAVARLDALLEEGKPSPLVGRDVLGELRDELRADPAGWAEQHVDIETVPAGA